MSEPSGIEQSPPTKFRITARGHEAVQFMMKTGKTGERNWLRPLQFHPSAPLADIKPYVECQADVVKGRKYTLGALFEAPENKPPALDRNMLAEKASKVGYTIHEDKGIIRFVYERGFPSRQLFLKDVDSDKGHFSLITTNVPDTQAFSFAYNTFGKLVWAVTEAVFDSAGVPLPREALFIEPVIDLRDKKSL